MWRDDSKMGRTYVFRLQYFHRLVNDEVNVINNSVLNARASSLSECICAHFNDNSLFQLKPGM